MLTFGGKSTGKYIPVDLTRSLWHLMLSSLIFLWNTYLRWRLGWTVQFILVRYAAEDGAGRLLFGTLAFGLQCPLGISVLSHAV